MVLVEQAVAIADHFQAIFAVDALRLETLANRKVEVAVTSLTSMNVRSASTIAATRTSSVTRSCVWLKLRHLDDLGRFNKVLQDVAGRRLTYGEVTGKA